MPIRRLIVFAALLAALPVPATAGSDPAKKASASFHIQVDATENPKMIFQQQMNGQMMVFRRSPEVSSRDILNYSPFPADEGDGYGAVFRLKGSAAQRFAGISNASQGRWLAAMVNGRIVDGVLIDKQIQDGVIVVWRGLAPEDIVALDKAFKRSGQEGDKKKD